MNFIIKNFGKIAEADIKLDGITVICGNNNTGKSTVGKALFSFYNSLNDYKNKIDAQKYDKVRNTIRIYGNRVIRPHRFLKSTDSLLDFISEHNDHFDKKEVMVFLESCYGVKLPKEGLDNLVEYLNTSEYDILNEYVHRYITNVMNGQVKNAYSSNGSTCSISGEFKHFTKKIRIKKQTCTCDKVGSIEHSAYFISSIQMLDDFNDHGIFRNNLMVQSTVDAILQAQAKINEDSMTNILDVVLNKKDLDEVRKVLKTAYKGNTIIDHGIYYYSENGIAVDFRNISAGLKSFAIIERLLETGVLKKKDVLIFDEPEIHLHSEWQIIYAELIVILQKTFDLTILLVTHSFHFLESLDFFMKKYGTHDNANYYIPKETDKGYIMNSCGNDALELKKNLSEGSVKLSDLKFKYEMENYSEENN